jgi:hypothetical protein
MNGSEAGKAALRGQRHPFGPYSAASKKSLDGPMMPGEARKSAPFTSTLQDVYNTATLIRKDRVQNTMGLTC